MASATVNNTAQPFDSAAECQKLLDLRKRVQAGVYPQFSIKSSSVLNQDSGKSSLVSVPASPPVATPAVAPQNAQMGPYRAPSPVLHDSYSPSLKVSPPVSSEDARSNHRRDDSYHQDDPYRPEDFYAGYASSQQYPIPPSVYTRDPYSNSRPGPSGPPIGPPQGRIPYGQPYPPGPSLYDYGYPPPTQGMDDQHKRKREWEDERNMRYPPPSGQPPSVGAPGGYYMMQSRHNVPPSPRPYDPQYDIPRQDDYGRPYEIPTAHVPTPADRHYESLPPQPPQISYPQDRSISPGPSGYYKGPGSISGMSIPEPHISKSSGIAGMQGVIIEEGYTRDNQRGYELFIPSAAKSGRYLTLTNGEVDRASNETGGRSSREVQEYGARQVPYMGPRNFRREEW
ncbi:uncharacterized protein V1516DRAFT_667656 [Lipomyces oligophaga]|uniref:uncharacterized protein n=1 Tax=Lipomyces oligophaga TaxID=45792 RepID=UPI0034CDBE0A